MNRIPLFSRVVSVGLVWSLSGANLWSQTSLPALTAGQERILRALDQTAQFDFDKEPLAKVLDYIRQRQDIQVQADYKALTDAGVGSDTPIDFRLRDISLRSALWHLCRQLDLTTVTRDGYLLVTSKVAAENLGVPRVYVVGDLVTVDGKPDAPRDSNYQTLIELITTTVTPTTWDEGSGPPPVAVFSAGRAIIVLQTQDAHEEIKYLLAALRAARDKQYKLAEPPRLPEPEKDDGVLSTRVYPLHLFPAQGFPIGAGGLSERSGILAQMGGGMGGMGMAGAFGIGLQQWASDLAGLLPQFVEPMSWEVNGGKGVVRPLGGLLIVKQTEAIHRRVAKLLEDLVRGAPMRGQYAPTRLAPRAPRGPLRNWPTDPEPRPGEREAAIERALATKMNVDFDEVPLGKLKEWIRESHNIQLAFDDHALSDAGLNPATPVTFHLSDVTLRQALRAILDGMDLTYVVTHEVLLVTSKVEAENMLTTRVYPILDLATTSSPDVSLPSRSDYHSLVEIITMNVKATAWDGIGGPATIQEYPNCGALVVSQTEAGHEQVWSLLQSLRAARNLAEEADEAERVSR